MPDVLDQSTHHLLKVFKVQIDRRRKFAGASCKLCFLKSQMCLVSWAERKKEIKVENKTHFPILKRSGNSVILRLRCEMIWTYLPT